MKSIFVWNFFGVGLALALFVAPARADSSEMLGQLGCVFLVVEEVSGDAQSLGVTPSFLQAALKVGVTENLPRLRIDDSCVNDLYLNVSVVRGEGDGALEYSALVRLELRRMAEVLENNTRGMVTVWDASTLIAGRPDEKNKVIMETIRELAADFGRVSRAAGNF